jgi:hypothetical protein
MAEKSQPYGFHLAESSISLLIALSKPVHPHQNKSFITPITIPIRGMNNKLIPKITIGKMIYFIKIYFGGDGGN